MKQKSDISIMIKITLILLFIFSLYNTVNYLDVKSRFTKVYTFTLGNTFIYADNIKNSLENNDSIPSMLLVRLGQSINSQLELSKTFNTNYKERIPIPIAEIMSYRDAIEIITYKVLNDTYNEEDINVLQVICSDFILMRESMIIDNRIRLNEYNRVRGNLRLFRDLDIWEYINKHDHIFKQNV